MKRAVQVVAYDDRWPEAFRREERRLAALLGPAASAIHHIGSTSVPGLCAKPVLDVLVETADLATIDRLQPAFVAAGYVSKGEHGIAGRRYFSRPEGTELKTHVHAFQGGDPAVVRHLLFRDFLRLHPEVAAEYCALKRQLAHEHGRNAEAYQAGKNVFISRIESLAAAKAASNYRSLPLRATLRNQEGHRLMTVKNPKVEAFLNRATRWQDEMRALREILLDCDLTEELKWGKPCYTAHGGNIVIIQPFKAHLSLMFFKGSLLDDDEGLLRSQGENTQAALRMEFTSLEQVCRLSSILKSYIEEAIAVERAGLEVPKKKVGDYEVAPEFAKRLREDESYRDAFEALTPGRKKSYLVHFSGAKRASTRERRIEKCRAKVLEGKGFNER